MKGNALEVDYYFHRGQPFIKGQPFITKIEWLDTIGTMGFSHDIGTGIIHSIEIKSSIKVNSSLIGFGQYLNYAQATIKVSLDDDSVVRVIPSEVHPISIPSTKKLKAELISRYKRANVEQIKQARKTLGYDKLLDQYIINLLTILSKRYDKETDFEEQMFSICRVDSDKSPDEDGMINICRTDNPLRKLVYKNN